jgi:hypothetical protein
LGSTVTFTPVKGQVEFSAQPVTATAADAAKNVSAASAAVTYSFDNVSPAAPTIAAGAKPGSISVNSAEDVVAFGILADGVDIGAKFTIEEQSSTVDLLVPKILSFDGKSQNISVVGLDKAGNASAASGALTYTFDNIPPAAPTVTATAATGVITVALAPTSDAATTKLLAGTTDITSKFTSAVLGSTVTFTPVKGQVEFSAQPVTATAADAAKNVSAASTALTYSFDNIPPAAPTIAAGAKPGSISVTSASDVVAFGILADGVDIGAKFTIEEQSSTVDLLVPKLLSFDGKSQNISVVGLDKAGNASAASGALTYKFDNIPPAAAPTAVQVDSKTGVITMSIGADATTAKLSVDGKDVTTNFTATGPANSLTFTPLPEKVEYVAKDILINAADAAGNTSTASTKQAYTFDNVAPLAPSSVDPNSTNGNVTVGFGTANGQVPSSVKLFAGTSEITGKYVADASVAGTVTFVPVAGQVVLSNQTLTATVADAAGNASVASKPSATYTFANAIDVNASNAPTVFKASGANYQFTLAEGDYKATIDGFGAGDRLVFKGAVVPSIDVSNSNLADGKVDLTAISGDNLVELELSGIGAVDSQIFFESSFNPVFGPESLTTLATVSSAPTTFVSINSNNAGSFDASKGNFAYTLAEGQYLSTIKGLGAGDTVNFSGASKAALDLINEDFSDGTVVISANFASGVVDLTLTELQPIAVDASTNFVSDLNRVFGAGTITSSVAGQAAAQPVTVSAGNASVELNAANGNFTYNFAEGSYKAKIVGFTAGDSLVFFGQKGAEIDLENNVFGDGEVLITATTSGGSVVDLTLSGLSSSADLGLLFKSSVDGVFGVGSLIA